MRRVIRIAFEFDKIFGTKMRGKDYAYVHEYGSLTERSNLLGNLILGIKLTPQRMSPKGKVFFTYLMSVYNKDLKEL